MKFSCADFTFPLLPHGKALQLIKLLDIDAVDLGLFEDRSHHNPSRIAAAPEAEARQLRETLDRIELVPSDVFLQMGAEPALRAVNDPDLALRAGNREIFSAILKFTAELGCAHLTGLPGVFHPGSDPERDLDLARQETAWRVGEAEKRGLAYAIEAHVGSILVEPRQVLNFLADVPGLTLTLDYGHFVYQGIENDAILPLLPHASHIHVRGGAPGKLQSTMAENQINFPSIRAELGALGYGGFTCLEYVYVDWEGCNRTDNVSETLRLMRALGSHGSSGSST